MNDVMVQAPASCCSCGMSVGLRPNLTPLAFASARPRAVRSRMRRRSSFAATPSIARTSSAKSDVVSTTGSAIERRPAPGALHVAGDHQKIGCIAREPVNSRGDDNIAGAERLHQLLQQPVGDGAGDLLAEHLFAAGSLQLGKLAGEVLSVGRDAGIAVKSCPHCA
jgi:hypothetical protein